MYRSIHLFETTEKGKNKKCNPANWTNLNDCVPDVKGGTMLK
jgi:hypothetical protein